MSNNPQQQFLPDLFMLFKDAGYSVSLDGTGSRVTLDLSGVRWDGEDDNPRITFALINTLRRAFDGWHEADPGPNRDDAMKGIAEIMSRPISWLTAKRLAEESIKAHKAGLTKYEKEQSR